MKKTILPLVNQILELNFYILFFLVPLILTPWNYELFEFNKMMLTFLLTIIITSTWVVKMIIEKRIIFRRTILDLPLILFLISQIISTIYSLDRHTSLWGYYSRFNGGLFSTISYLLLYWVYVSNFNKEKTLTALRFTLTSAILVSLYGLAEHFGIDAQYWVQEVQIRVFSTLGQPNWLAAWLVALLPLAWTIILLKKQPIFKKFSFPYLGYILTTIFFLCLLYTKSRSGLIGLAGAYLLFWGLIGLINRQKIKELAKPFISLSLLLLVLTLLTGTPWTPHLGQIKEKIIKTPTQEATIPAESQPGLLISESGDIRKIVWQGALEIWKDHPILGTGVETFGYAYYWYRPRAHNDVSEWDLLYNKAHNEYLTLLANTGLIGLFTYLILIGTFLFWSLKQIITHLKKAKETILLIIALLAGYISILITNFFGFSVVPISLLFFLLPAMAIVLTSQPEKEPKPQKQILENKQWAAIILISLLSLSTIIYLLKFWYADTRFALAEKLNEATKYDQAYKELQTAINLHPSEPYYRAEMALSLAGLAELAQEADNASLAGQLVDLAIAESDQALKTSPYHLNFWKKRAKMFISLALTNPHYEQEALNTLLKAADLAQTDAKIQYNLALLYSHLGQKETAIKTLEHAIELKPNYADARYALALFYEENKQKEEARKQLNYILEKINPADTRAIDKLKTL